MKTLRMIDRFAGVCFGFVAGVMAYATKTGRTIETFPDWLFGCFRLVVMYILVWAIFSFIDHIVICRSDDLVKTVEKLQPNIISTPSTPLGTGSMEKSVNLEPDLSTPPSGARDDKLNTFFNCLS